MKRGVQSQLRSLQPPSLITDHNEMCMCCAMPQTADVNILKSQTDECAASDQRVTDSGSVTV